MNLRWNWKRKGNQRSVKRGKSHILVPEQIKIDAADFKNKQG